MIKRLDETYKNQVRHLYETAFTEDGPAFVDHYMNDYKEMEDVIGILSDDAEVTDISGQVLKPLLKCMLHLNPYQVMWQGQLYTTSYVVAVATDAAYRRQGLMRKILNFTLQELYDSGEVFTLLMPIDSRFYDQFGFGFIQDVRIYKFNYKNLNRQLRDIPYKELESRDSIELLPIYNHYKRQFNLSHNRGMRALDMLISEAHSENGKVVMLPDAYVVYYVNETVFVRESAYTSEEGLFAILDYIGSIAGDKTIEWQMPSDNPLKHLVPHMVGHETVSKPFMMARVINVRDMLEDMAEVIGNLCIKVFDDQLLVNNATYRINEEGVEVTQDDPDLVMDVESLVSWLFGYETLENLAFVRPRVVLFKDVIFYPEIPILNYFNEFV